MRTIEEKREYERQRNLDPRRRAWVREYRKRYRKTAVFKQNARKYKQSISGKAANKRQKLRYKTTKRGKEAIRAYSRMSNLRRYGLTEDAYNAMLIGQAFGCAICGRQRGSSHRKNLFVDHCHQTNEIRGLLCGRCNFIIGQAEDNPEMLVRMIDYLVGGGISR